MSRTTTNYGFNISEGSDLVNPLVDIFPNFEDIDTDLKSVSDAAIGSATELQTGTVHALTRADSDRDVFYFVATANYTAGDTFTLDGVQVSALTPDGQQLSSGAYVIGAKVLVSVNSTLLTFYLNPAKSSDSDKLDGHDSTYYAKESDLETLDNTVDAISEKVGTAILQTTAPDLSGAVNELNSNLTNLGNSVAKVYNNVTISGTTDVDTLSNIMTYLSSKTLDGDTAICSGSAGTIGMFQCVYTKITANRRQMTLQNYNELYFADHEVGVAMHIYKASKTQIQ